jgi:hypothetical protein
MHVYLETLSGLWNAFGLACRLPLWEREFGLEGPDAILNRRAPFAGRPAREQRVLAGFLRPEEPRKIRKFQISNALCSVLHRHMSANNRKVKGNRS